MEWDFFYRQLDMGLNIDEICFCFSDDKDRCEHYAGYLPQYEKPYWVGYCDIKDGCEFKNAYELVNAPVFDGRSLKDRWNEVIVISVEGIPYEQWLKYMEHC